MAKEFVTKSELVSNIAKKANLKKADAEKALEAFIEVVKDSLSKGKGVRLIGFGTFAVRNRKARKSRNPRTGQTINIPATKVPAFKPSASLKALVAGKK